MQNENTSSENVDYDEINKFSAIADEWWSAKGKFASLHKINPLRMHYLIDRAGPLKDKVILDVGCGGGILSESMAKEGAIVTGLDMTKAALDVARLHATSQQLNIDYQLQTVEAHAKTHAGHYDIITCMEMLEHVPYPASIISACSALIKPQGKLFFSTINRNIIAWLKLIAGAEYLTKFVPRGTHDANKFIRPSELINWIECEGLTAFHITGLEYKPCTNSFMLTRNTTANYILEAYK